MIYNKRSWVIFFPAVLILMLIQSAVSPLFSFHSASADLVLVFVAVGVLFLNRNELLPIAIFAGLLFDTASGTRDGVLTLAFIFTVYLLYFLVVHFLPKHENRLIPAALTASATILFYLSAFLVSYGLSLIKLSSVLSFKYLFFERIWIELILNLIFVYPVFLYFHFWNNITAMIENKINR